MRTQSSDVDHLALTHNAGSFCADCRHVAVKKVAGLSEKLTEYTCDRPFTSLVTGKTEPLGLPAMDERSWRNNRPGACGPAGNNFEPKETSK